MVQDVVSLCGVVDRVRPSCGVWMWMSSWAGDMDARVVHTEPALKSDLNKHLFEDSVSLNWKILWQVWHLGQGVVRQQLGKPVWPGDGGPRAAAHACAGDLSGSDGADKGVGAGGQGQPLLPIFAHFHLSRPLLPPTLLLML